MPLRITQRIKRFQVVDEGSGSWPEPVERPEVLVGVTYRVHSPQFEHALYVTFNDILLNAGTSFEQRRPFEIFINTKNTAHFQWIVALTRIISAVFRQGGDCSFLVEELKTVSDPCGGYLKEDGLHMPSVVAEIGAVLERHLIAIGQWHGPPNAATPHQHHAGNETGKGPVALESGADFPPDAQRCGHCHTRAVVAQEGCLTCLNCGHSKCG